MPASDPRITALSRSQTTLCVRCSVACGSSWTLTACSVSRHPDANEGTASATAIAARTPRRPMSSVAHDGDDAVQALVVTVDEAQRVGVSRHGLVDLAGVAV